VRSARASNIPLARQTPGSGDHRSHHDSGRRLAAAVAEALDPRVKLLLERAPPPANPSDVRSRGAATGSDRGRPVDWSWPRGFRGLRNRLRSPRDLAADIQALDYQQSRPASRPAAWLRGQWLDLFVNTRWCSARARKISVGRAVVAYNCRHYAFLEPRAAARDRQRQPDAEGCRSFGGAARAISRRGGGDLKVGIDATPREVSTGEAIQVRVPHRPRNVSLWPEPQGALADGVRCIRAMSSDADAGPRPDRRHENLSLFLVADSVGLMTCHRGVRLLRSRSRRYLETRTGPALVVPRARWAARARSRHRCCPCRPVSLLTLCGRADCQLGGHSRDP